MRAPSRWNKVIEASRGSRGTAPRLSNDSSYRRSEGTGNRCGGPLCTASLSLPEARPCVTRLPLALLTRLKDDPAKCPVERGHEARSRRGAHMTFDIIRAAILGVVEGLT